MINDALRASGITGANFLRDFDMIWDEDASWSTTSSGLSGWTIERLIVNRSGLLITAFAQLSKTTLLTMDGSGGSLIIHGAIPHTLQGHLTGRQLSVILGHPLTARSEYAVTSVLQRPADRRWRFGFPITPEALIP